MGFGIWGLVETYGNKFGLAKSIVGSDEWTYI